MAEKYVRPLVAESKHGRNPFYIGMAMLVAIIFVRNLYMETMPVIVVLAVASAVALISDRDELCAMAICCIPMSAAFQYKYFILICMIIYLLKYYGDFRISMAVFPLLLLMWWELLHGFFGTFSIVEYIRGFTELIFCTFLLLSVRRKVDYPLVCRMLAVVTVCMLSIAFIKLLRENQYSFESVFSGGYRFGKQSEEGSYLLNYNANAVGFICNLAIIGLMQLNMARRGTVRDYLLLAVLFLFGTMTMSRSFLVCFALILGYYIFANAGDNRKRVLRMATTIALITFLIFVVYWLVPELFRQYLERFVEDDISNGRLDLLAFYNEHIFSEPKYLFFGIGLQDIGGKIRTLYRSVGLNVPHNGIQETVVCWGLPGLAFVGVYLGTMIYTSKRMNEESRHSLFSFMPFILVLVKAQSGQMITSSDILLGLSYSYLSLCWNPLHAGNGHDV